MSDLQYTTRNVHNALKGDISLLGRLSNRQLTKGFVKLLKSVCLCLGILLGHIDRHVGFVEMCLLEEERGRRKSSDMGLGLRWN